jgi:hypothetical protein
VSAEPVDDHDEEEDVIDVDVDLDALDEDLRRERIGDSSTVRIDGKIIHVAHAGTWTSSAMRAAAGGDWETWAREVIEDDDEFNTWVESDLRNYQIEAVFEACARRARMSSGKSQRRRGPYRSSRRK